jgi:hypothetical protein
MDMIISDRVPNGFVAKNVPTSPNLMSLALLRMIRVRPARSLMANIHWVSLCLLR